MKQQIAHIPVYVDRNSGEKEIAYKAVNKGTFDEAVKLDKSIDGNKSIVNPPPTSLQIAPKSNCQQGMTSYFFELKALGKEAKMYKSTTFILPDPSYPCPLYN